METIIYHIVNLYETGIATYSILAYTFYALLTAIALIELTKYFRRNGFVDYNIILSSPMSPGISLIAPAYNECETIIENVHSLMSLHYRNFEVIIVNDGSKDDTLSKLISEFSLRKIKSSVKEKIETSRVRGVYKSRHSALAKLTVIDKENGGKADALNAGLNISRNPLIACIDVDCVLESDALLKLVKPFLDKDNVIATGGVIRVANSCKVEDGKLTEVTLPKGILARFQVLEYMRAFLIGRMAWSSVNGLLLISGALGLFRKDVAIACGGYDRNTVGEDMELVVRMRRYLADKNIKHKIVYVPDPLCWTEVPATKQVLKNQRNRWTRGTIDVVLKHRKMFMNPKYGILGLVSIPTWAVYEWVAPILEFLGFFGMIASIFLGYFNFHFWMLLFLSVYFFVVMLSTFALLAEEISFCRYTKQSDILKMFGIALLEPIIYYPQKVLWAIQGNLQKIKGQHQWGEMKRQGFKTS